MISDTLVTISNGRFKGYLVKTGTLNLGSDKLVAVKEIPVPIIYNREKEAAEKFTKLHTHLSPLTSLRHMNIVTHLFTQRHSVPGNALSSSYRIIMEFCSGNRSTAAFEII